MSEVDLSVTYHGPALDAGEIEVEDLSPSLLGLAHLLQSASKHIYGDGTTFRLAVRSGAKTSSFELELALLVLPLFGASAGKVAEAASGLWEWFKKAVAVFSKDEKPTVVKQTVNNITNNFTADTVLLQYGDKSTIEFTAGEARALADKRVHKQMKALVEPARRKRASRISLSKRGAKKPVEITSEDAQVIDRARPEAIQPPTEGHIEFDAWVSLAKAALEENLSFEIRFGEDRPIEQLRMLDDDFLGRVMSRSVTFSAGAVLHVHIRALQTVHADGRLEMGHYEALRVIEYRVGGPSQPLLPL